MRYTQPQSGPLQIEQSPLGAMLRASIISSMGVEPVNRRQLTLASSVTRVVNRHGVGFQHAVSNGGVAFGAATGMLSLIETGVPISVFVRLFVSVTGVRQIFFSDYDSAGNFLSWTMELTAANQYSFGTYSTSTFSAVGGTVTAGWHDVLAVHIPNTSNYLYVDGVLVANSANPTTITGTAGQGLRLGSAGLYNLLGFQGQTSVCHIYRGDLREQRATLSANPWQVIKSPQRVMLAAAVAGIALNSDATTISIASSSLATQIALSASAASPSSANAALTAGSAPLASDAVTPSSASASLTTQVMLSASSAAPSSALSGLTTQVALTANGKTDAGASSMLATQVALAAESSTGASALAALTTQVALSSAASSRAMADASLATQVQLAADARSPSSASASLTVGAVWAASASTGTSAAASLTTGVSIGASAQTSASASAALATAIALTAAALSKASAEAVLTTQVALAAVATAAASSSSQLATGIAMSSSATAPASATANLTAPGSGFAADARTASFASASLTTQIALAAAAVSSAQASGNLTMGVRYARAPAGNGYTPQRDERSSRPTSGAQSRPAQVQRNQR